MPSETFLEDSYDVLGFAHRVEMNGRYAVCNQILALGDAPFRSNLIYSILVFCFRYLACKFERYIERK